MWPVDPSRDVHFESWIVEYQQSATMQQILHKGESMDEAIFVTKKFLYSETCL